MRDSIIYTLPITDTFLYVLDYSYGHVPAYLHVRLRHDTQAYIVYVCRGLDENVTCAEIHDKYTGLTADEEYQKSDFNHCTTPYIFMVLCTRRAVF